MANRMSARFWNIADILGMEIEVDKANNIFGSTNMQVPFAGSTLRIPLRIASSLVTPKQAVVLALATGNLGFLLISGDATNVDSCFFYVLDCTKVPPLTSLMESRGWKSDAEVLAGLDAGIVAGYALASDSTWTKVFPYAPVDRHDSRLEVDQA